MTSTLDRYITTQQGARIHVEITGDGPPLILVPGLAGDTTEWDAQVSALCQRFCCIAIDNRGIGKSSTPPGPYTIEQMALDAHDVVSALGVAPVLAVGESMGGAICQQWAVSHPDDLKAMVLTNTTGDGTDPKLQFLLDHWIHLCDLGLGAELLESMFLMSFGSDFVARKPTVREEWMSAAQNLAGTAFAAAALKEHRALGKLTKLQIPTLVIVADLDIITPPTMGTALANAIPDAQIAHLAAAHASFIEMPTAWRQSVEEFLRSVLASS